ncbi:DUF5677 domain-containing protein [Marimonas arenosa]|uniref:DUF5677 domain-containing protein n=1 Tax=Marimonas arenosa TaxID=1795305 RepID=A0AAE3W9A6_9RHOB|nr:DUF5677 domain-containing protein [Marimonas arenosa]MDQ2088584.1 DUF5677 domain-containing protein [Marimonas arenosa]
MSNESHKVDQELLSIGEYIHQYRGFFDLLKRADGPSKPLKETLISLDLMSNAVSASLLRQVAEGHLTAGEILLRSAFEGHAISVKILTHSEGPEFANWEYNSCLGIFSAEKDIRRLLEIKKKASAMAASESAAFGETSQTYIEKDIDQRVESLKEVCKNKRINLNPKTKKGLSQKDYNNIADSWRFESLCDHLSNVGMPIIFDALDSYQFGSKAAHFASESLLYHESMQPGFMVDSGKPHRDRFAYNCLRMIAERKQLLWKILKLDGYPLEKSMVEFFRELKNRRHVAVSGELLGLFTVKKVDGLNLTIEEKSLADEEDYPADKLFKE